MTTDAFDGSIPHFYEQGLGPLLFHWSAEELARCIEARPDQRVLETACGTGIATEALRKGLPEEVGIVATDLHQPMLDEAMERRGSLPGVEFQAADAQALPFADGAFDAVACQFGIMFFPDKALALREARRVLVPGGQLAFSVWDSLEANPSAKIAHETIAGFFPEDPPRFLEIPFGYQDEQEIRELVTEAGFSEVGFRAVDRQMELPSARGVAEGYVQGNPTVTAIRERGRVEPEVVVDAVHEALVQAFGEAPMRTPLRAIFVTARR